MRENLSDAEDCNEELVDSDEEASSDQAKRKVSNSATTSTLQNYLEGLIQYRKKVSPVNETCPQDDFNTL